MWLFYQGFKINFFEGGGGEYIQYDVGTVQFVAPIGD